MCSCTGEAIISIVAAMSSTVCPTQETLHTFALGKMGGFEWTSTAAHVDLCPCCQTLLEKFDGASDGLVHELHQLPSAPKSKRCEDEGWTSKLHVRGITDALTRHIVADAGRDLAQRLHEGPVRLDRFELRAELGVGSFGHVFRALDPSQERIVALKVQRAGILATQEETQRFVRHQLPSRCCRVTTPNVHERF